MLNQGDHADQRQFWAQRLSIAPDELAHVTNSGEGQGLLFFGDKVIPFEDRFPKNTKLYQLMTTKLRNRSRKEVPMQTDVIYNMDALEALRSLPDESVHCCVTSPPYYASGITAWRDRSGGKVRPTSMLRV